MGSLTHQWGGGMERWAECWMEKTPHSTESLPTQNSLSPSPFTKFHLILKATPFFFYFHTQYFPQIWEIIQIFPPPASESNLISLQSTPANLVLMPQSYFLHSHLSYLSAAFSKSPIVSNLDFITISHTNVYLKISNVLFSLWWALSLSFPSLTFLWISILNFQYCAMEAGGSWRGEIVRSLQKHWIVHIILISAFLKTEIILKRIQHRWH